MNREWWLSQRRTGVGSSDAAAVCGQSPWSTAAEVYGDKLGLLPERTPSTAMVMGSYLEDAIAKYYTDQTGRAVVGAQFKIDRHSKHEWMIASLDRWTPERDRIIECKTASAYAADQWGEPGTDQIPEYYTIQVQHQMAVTGIPITDVPVLIGGQDFRIYTVECNLSMIRSLIEIEQDFWQRVLERRPPDPDFSHPTTGKMLSQLYGVNEFLSVTLPEEAVLLVEAYERYGAAKSEQEEACSEVKARLLHMLGEAAIGYLPDGRTLTRKQVTRKAYSVNESTYTDFRIKKGKVKK